MERAYTNQFGEEKRFRLETLIKIRWLAVAGQTIAVLLVAFVFEYEFPLAMCLFAVACSAWLNIFLRLRYPLNHRLTAMTAIALLSYDTLQLTLLLFLTGGLENPFALLLIVPVIISATIQSILQTLLVGSLVIVSATLLTFFHLPLPWATSGGFDLPLTYVLGVWVAIISSLTFTALYVFRVADESRKLANALTATELVLQREQHLSTLDGLAAAAAHELGTPLATIALVSKEMIRELDQDSALMEDARLLRSQAERCREILKKLSSLSDEGNVHIGSLSLPSMLEEIVEPHRNFGIELLVECTGDTPEPLLTRNPAILYGLGNLVENAIDFARGRVSVAAKWSNDTIDLEITDDGSGFKSDLLERIGEPFITTRNSANAETGGGLGLGLFIAKTLLERSGATLVFRNANSFNESGAQVLISWQRIALDRTSQPVKAV